jgi:hypothetical protein
LVFIFKKLSVFTNKNLSNVNQFINTRCKHLKQKQKASLPGPMHVTEALAKSLYLLSLAVDVEQN